MWLPPTPSVERADGDSARGTSAAAEPRPAARSRARTLSRVRAALPIEPGRGSGQDVPLRLHPADLLSDRLIRRDSKPSESRPSESRPSKYPIDYSAKTSRAPARDDRLACRAAHDASPRTAEDSPTQGPQPDARRMDPPRSASIHSTAIHNACCTVPRRHMAMTKSNEAPGVQPTPTVGVSHRLLARVLQKIRPIPKEELHQIRSDENRDRPACIFRELVGRSDQIMSHFAGRRHDESHMDSPPS